MKTFKVYGFRDAISAAVGCSLAASDNLQQKSRYLFPLEAITNFSLAAPTKENGGIPYISGIRLYRFAYAAFSKLGYFASADATKELFRKVPWTFKPF